jgi:hypothetical protein
MTTPVWGDDGAFPPAPDDEADACDGPNGALSARAADDDYDPEDEQARELGLIP